MSVNPSAQSVTFNITLGDGGMTINGKGNGGTAISVPQGWSVTLNCKNASSGIPHSCAVVDSQGNDTVQFNASTSNATSGMGSGQSQVTTFKATTVGTFRLACLVPGHEGAGMWATFTVTPSGSPSIS